MSLLPIPGLLPAFSLCCFLIFSCGEPTRSVTPSADFIVEPGREYRIVFPDPIDTFEIGTIFNELPLLSESPIAPMYRRSLIIKADDLRANLSLNWRSFIRWARAESYAVGLGLICNSLSVAPPADLTFLRNLDKWRNELWLHGWDHEVGNDMAEFSGHSLAHQASHISESIKWTKKKLGLDLRTFGPPGNRFDSFTSEAIEQNPELKVWFHTGSPGKTPLVIKTRWIAESSTGVLRPFEEFRTEIAKHEKEDVLVLQIHPAQWERGDLLLFERMVDYTITTLQSRLVTPFGYYAWIRDRAKVEIEKIGRTEYRLDCRSLEFPHLLEFDVNPTQFQILYTPDKNS